jgi:hypothetical protein
MKQVDIRVFNSGKWNEKEVDMNTLKDDIREKVESKLIEVEELSSKWDTIWKDSKWEGDGWSNHDELYNLKVKIGMLEDEISLLIIKKDSYKGYIDWWGLLFKVTSSKYYDLTFFIMWAMAFINYVTDKELMMSLLTMYLTAHSGYKFFIKLGREREEKASA